MTCRRCQVLSRNPILPPLAATSRAGVTSGTRECSSPRRAHCSRRSDELSRNCTPVSLSLHRSGEKQRPPPRGAAPGGGGWVVDDPATRGSGVDRIWPHLEKIAIDYSVAEPAAAAGRLAVVRGHFAWDDVGDFASLAKLNSHGQSGDLAILGEGARVLSDSSSGIVVSRSKRVISLIGVQDIVVVDTPDALLVTTSEHAQRVKVVVDALRLGGSSDVL